MTDKVLKTQKNVLNRQPRTKLVSWKTELKFCKNALEKKKQMPLLVALASFLQDLHASMQQPQALALQKNLAVLTQLLIQQLSFWAECCWWLGHVLSPVRIPIPLAGKLWLIQGPASGDCVQGAESGQRKGNRSPALQSTSSSASPLTTLPLLWNSAGSIHSANNYAFNHITALFSFLTDLFLYLSYVPWKFLNLLDIDPPPPPDCPQPPSNLYFLNFFSQFQWDWGRTGVPVCAQPC